MEYSSSARRTFIALCSARRQPARQAFPSSQGLIDNSAELSQYEDATTLGRGRKIGVDAVDQAGSSPSTDARAKAGREIEPSSGRNFLCPGSDLISLIVSRQNLDDYQKKHWSGSFAEYLDIVRRDPRVTRTAYHDAFTT